MLGTRLSSLGGSCDWPDTDLLSSLGGGCDWPVWLADMLLSDCLEGGADEDEDEDEEDAGAGPALGGGGGGAAVPFMFSV